MKLTTPAPPDGVVATSLSMSDVLNVMAANVSILTSYAEKTTPLPAWTCHHLESAGFTGCVNCREQAHQESSLRVTSVVEVPSVVAGIEAQDRVVWISPALHCAARPECDPHVKPSALQGLTVNPACQELLMLAGATPKRRHSTRVPRLTALHGLYVPAAAAAATTVTAHAQQIVRHAVGGGRRGCIQPRPDPGASRRAIAYAKGLASRFPRALGGARRGRRLPGNAAGWSEL